MGVTSTTAKSPPTKRCQGSITTRPLPLLRMLPRPLPLLSLLPPLLLVPSPHPSLPLCGELARVLMWRPLMPTCSSKLRRGCHLDSMLLAWRQGGSRMFCALKAMLISEHSSSTKAGMRSSGPTYTAGSASSTAA